MAGPQLGFKICFYLYPCLLFIVLLGAQSFEFYLHRHRAPVSTSPNAEQKTKVERLQRLCARLIWPLQLALSILLLVSVILAVREVVAGKYDGAGSIEFPLTAYVVCTASYSLNV
jgi:hypothetical protein